MESLNIWFNHRHAPHHPCLNGTTRINAIDHGRKSKRYSRFELLIFDDVVLVPGISDVSPDVVDTTSWFSLAILLNVPLLSAAMDKVTEGRLDFAMARIGGIGVVHRNLTIKAQAA